MAQLRVWTLLAIACVLAGSVAPVLAQGGPGQVIGVVRDVTGGNVPGASVTLTGGALTEARQTVTNRNGEFQFAALPAGSYVLEVRMPSFFTYRQAPVDVRSGATTQAIVALAVAGANGPRTRPNPNDAAPVRVRMKTSAGDIDLEIDVAHAPITAGNFLKYVDAGLYNGGRFYRVTREGNYTPSPPNRPLMEIVQGGIDPSKGAQRLPAIPLERTTTTGLHHGVGVISMARGNAADTATSEFFILLNDQPSLDMGGKRFDDEQGAAAFGKVVAGMDVVRTINQGPATGDRLVTPVVIESVTRIK